MKILILTCVLLLAGCVYYPSTYADSYYYPDTPYIASSYYSYSGYNSFYPYWDVNPSLNLNFSYPYYRSSYSRHYYPNYNGYRYPRAWHGHGGVWKGHDGHGWQGHGGRSWQGQGGRGWQGHGGASQVYGRGGRR